MGLKIERKNDARFVKPILNRVADIPGGVTIQTSVLGGAALLEGTPIGPVANGMYGVCKTAKLVTDAANNAVVYEVAKGHHFKVGDLLAVVGGNGKAITAIDKTTNADKDVITVATTLGVALPAANGVVLFQSAGANQTLLVVPNSIAGSSYDVETTNNMFVDAWLIAAIKAVNAPGADATVKTALKGVFYI